MDVFVCIRRGASTIFTDLKETATVLELKYIIQGIMKRPAEDQKLYKLWSRNEKGEFDELDDAKTLRDSGLDNTVGKPQQPAELGLVLKDGDAFEEFELVPYSVPPELPDVMRSSQSQDRDVSMDQQTNAA